MGMILPEFLLFAIYGVVNAYLPLFLRNSGYSASEIGILYGFFNAAGVVLPALLTPFLSKRGGFAFCLVILGILLALIPFPLFMIRGFAFAAFFMSLYAVPYRWVVPVSDLLITKNLGTRQERYGFIRVFGSIGFVAMTLLMQAFVQPENCGQREMILWISAPAFLFVFSMLARNLFESVRSLKSAKSEKNLSPVNAAEVCQCENPAESKDSSLSTSKNEKSTGQILKSFGPGFYAMILVIFFEFFGMTPANQYLSIYVQEELKINAAGLLWALNSIVEIPFMFFSGFIIKKVGEKPLILLCTLMVTVRNLLYAFLPGFAGALAGQLTHSFTYGLFYPACVCFCSKASESGRSQGMLAMMVFQTAYGISNVVGSPVGGFLIDLWGYRPLFCFFAFFPLLSVILYKIWAFSNAKK